MGITLVGRAATTRELPELLREWLVASGDDFVLERRHALRARDVLDRRRSGLHIWLVVSADEARLYFADGLQQRYLVRVVPLRNGLDEVGREQLAQVLVSSTEAFRERRVSSTPTDVAATFGGKEHFHETSHSDTSSEAGASRESAVSSWVWRSRIGIAYSATARGETGLGHGPASLVGLLARRGNSTWDSAIAVQLLLPTEVQSERIRLRLRGVGGRWTMGYTLALTPTLGVGPEWGLGIDSVTHEPGSRPDSGIETTGGGHDFVPRVQGGLRLTFGRETWHIGASLFLSVPWVDTHYDVAVNDTREVEFAPWRVQPGFSLAGTYD